MRQVHSIRLKGPWNYEWIDPLYSTLVSPGFEPSGQVTLPASWEECFGSTCGRVRWSRRFQSPTNLESNERVLIAGRGIQGISKVCLGDVEFPSQLAPENGFLVDVTDALAASNVLRFLQEVTDIEMLTGMNLPVMIEIWTDDESGGLAPQV